MVKNNDKNMCQLKMQPRNNKIKLTKLCKWSNSN